MTPRPDHRLDFEDSRSQRFPVPVTPRQAYALMTGSLPPVIDALFTIRDVFGKFVGIAPIKGFSSANNAEINGKKLDFFDIERDEPDILALSSNDHHLCVDLYITRSPKDDHVITIESRVRCNNVIGKIYMLPVRPIHKVMTSWMLKRAALKSIS